MQRQVLNFTESRPVGLDVDQMLAEAIDQAGADDLDDTDGFGDRLAAHVAAIDGDTGLTQLTRGTLRQRVIRLLRNRLSLTDLIKRYPEIESILIEKPFIVVGMPRSGTTHLVNLIAADPRRRALPYWESQEPIPARGQGPDSFGVDPATREPSTSTTHSWSLRRWWLPCMTAFPRPSRRRWNSSTWIWPPMSWNGMRECLIGATTIWGWTNAVTTAT
ncbi:sulfotransferase family protein [Mycobacterium kansasii 732]|nr:sulfotransferase family protein [Mycobacterium kansasii 732]